MTAHAAASAAVLEAWDEVRTVLGLAGVATQPGYPAVVGDLVCGLVPGNPAWKFHTARGRIAVGVDVVVAAPLSYPLARVAAHAADLAQLLLEELDGTVGIEPSEPILNVDARTITMNINCVILKELQWLSA